jgi:hypothetical protein
MLAFGLATAARINQGSSISGAFEAASCAQARAECLSPRWSALVACFRAWLGRMGWLAMIISFQTNILSFYFDCQQTRNSISMVNSGGIFYLANPNGVSAKNLKKNRILSTSSQNMNSFFIR